MISNKTYNVRDFSYIGESQKYHDLNMCVAYDRGKNSRKSL